MAKNRVTIILSAIGVLLASVGCSKPASTETGAAAGTEAAGSGSETSKETVGNTGRIEDYFGEYKTEDVSDLIYQPLVSSRALTRADIIGISLVMKEDSFELRSGIQNASRKDPSYAENDGFNQGNLYGFKYRYGEPAGHPVEKLMTEESRFFDIKGVDEVRLIISEGELYLDMGLNGVFRLRKSA